MLEQQFPVSPPGRLAGPLYAGGALAWVAIVSALLLMLPPFVAALGAAVATAVITLAWRAARGAGPTTGVNLIGVRPRARVAVWLAAHYDSKGQPISMALRIVAVALALVGAVGLLVLGVGRLAGAGWDLSTNLVLTLPGIVGGLLLLGNRATNSSPGALDNATALVTVLGIVDRLPHGLPVGVLFLDAEEYGLLGASAIARERANLLADTAVLNFDGIDDRGAVVSIEHRPGPIVAAVGVALGSRRHRLLPIVVDGWALARPARECVTVMRGDWRTTTIVHTPRDTAARLSLEGCELVAARAADALARALT